MDSYVCLAKLFSRQLTNGFSLDLWDFFHTYRSENQLVLSQTTWPKWECCKVQISMKLRYTFVYLICIIVYRDINLLLFCCCCCCFCYMQILKCPALWYTLERKWTLGSCRTLAVHFNVIHFKVTLSRPSSAWECICQLLSFSSFLLFLLCSSIIQLKRELAPAL